MIISTTTRSSQSALPQLQQEFKRKSRNLLQIIKTFLFIPSASEICSERERGENEKWGDSISSMTKAMLTNTGNWLCRGDAALLPCLSAALLSDRGRCTRRRHHHLAVSFHLRGWEMPDTSAGSRTNSSGEALAPLAGLCSGSTKVAGQLENPCEIIEFIGIGANETVLKFSACFHIYPSVLKVSCDAIHNKNHYEGLSLHVLP